MHCYDKTIMDLRLLSAIFKKYFMKVNFSKIFLSHKGNLADKWNSYLFVYDKTLSECAGRNINILEVGVNNGGSLEIWSKFFGSSSRIIGVDINKKCLEINFSSANISLIIGDSNLPETRKKINQECNYFDVIVDDGSHRSADIINTFFNLLPLISGEGGIYIVEDLCCSYWQEFGGGIKNKFSAISFFKSLVDLINFQHWRSPFEFDEYLKEIVEDSSIVSEEAVIALKRIQDIKFVNSMCIVTFHNKKKDIGIGKRVMRGKISTVWRPPDKIQEIERVGRSQDNNIFNLPDINLFNN